MCQLLGMNCNAPTDVTFSFRGFAQRGGNTDQHADGWGIAFFEGGKTDDSLDPTHHHRDSQSTNDKGLRHFVDHQPACTSPVAELISRYPIKSRNVISHIRKATQGRVALENCHPFVRELWGRYWVFAHNGDLKGFAPHLHASFKPVGQTDSERAFCWIMQELAKSHAALPPVAELSITLRELAAHIAPHGTFNFLLSNGQALWAHSAIQAAAQGLFYVERAHPFAHATLSDEDVSINFADHTRPSDKVAVIVSAPLTSNESWTPFALGELKVFLGGELAGH